MEPTEKSAEDQAAIQRTVDHLERSALGLGTVALGIQQAAEELPYSCQPASRRASCSDSGH